MVRSTEEILKLADPWMAPISSARPGGERADEDDRYVAVVSEIEKLQSPAGLYNSRLWSVIDLGGELLREKAKDFRVACYVAYVRHRRDGLPGLLTGVALLTALIENWWDAMFPEPQRIRGRAAALDWFLEKSTDMLVRDRPSWRDRGTLGDLLAITARLKESARERFGAAAPAVGKLRSALERALFDAEGDPATDVPPVPPPPAVGAPPSDVAEMTSWLRDVGAALVHAAHTARRAARHDPGAYRMLRVGLYAHLPAPRRADLSGAMRLTPPSAELRERFAALARDGVWGRLLEEAEVTLPQHRFWIDLHRHSATALARLGLSHEGAVAEVARETLTLLRRMPTLLSLRFEDGTPLADAETQRWILSHALT